MENKEKIENLIISVMDWQPLTEFMSRNSRKTVENISKYGSHGVYLITNDECPPSEIFDERVGYVGKSANIFHRIYDIKGGEHGVRKYCNSKNISTESIKVKILFTEKDSESYLESLIHEEMEKNFGYRFSWKEASGGNDGIVLRVLESIDKIDSIQQLKEIAKFVDEKATTIFINTWKNED